VARQTNEERSAATRAALLDAAVECLVERGYAGTSTTEISRRAGVSRGAQLHHFPTKEELLLAAVEHLFELRTAEFREALGAIPEGPGRADRCIDLLWSTFTGPTYHAWLEVAVAARTDPALQKKVRQLVIRMDRETDEVVNELFEPPQGQQQLMRMAGYLVFAAVAGLAVDRMVVERDDLPFDDVLTFIKSLVRGLDNPAAGS
jgi:AcrR family transcriptional regulator